MANTAIARGPDLLDRACFGSIEELGQADGPAIHRKAPLTLPTTGSLGPIPLVPWHPAGYPTFFSLGVPLNVLSWRHGPATKAWSVFIYVGKH